jgi:hypothetical protein
LIAIKKRIGFESAESQMHVQSAYDKYADKLDEQTMRKILEEVENGLITSKTLKIEYKPNNTLESALATSLGMPGARVTREKAPIYRKNNVQEGKLEEVLRNARGLR